jgi:hypothetical protein
MTTESEAIITSVDADVLSLDNKIAAMQKERAELAETQTAERAEQQRAKFDELVGGPSAILDATGIDLDALKAIGVTGFVLSIKPDADGGPDVISVAPVTAKATKTRTASSGGNTGTKRDLQGNFETNATDEERTAMAEILADGGDGNKVYSLRAKVYARING